ncbi:MAG: hypothetical protein MRY32_02400 [Rickettsiales bacterium]|nr:hypothetical protein [Rickettsiales bacterium]
MDEGKLDKQITSDQKEALLRFYSLSRSLEDINQFAEKQKTSLEEQASFDTSNAALEGIEQAKGVISELQSEIRRVQAELGGIGEPSHAAVGELMERIREAHGIIQQLQSGRMTTAAALEAIRGIKVGADAAISAANHEVGLDIGDAKIGIYQDYEQYEFVREMNNIYERQGNTLDGDEMRRLISGRLEDINRTTGQTITTRDDQRRISQTITTDPDLDKLMKDDPQLGGVVVDKTARGMAGNSRVKADLKTIEQNPHSDAQKAKAAEFRRELEQFIERNPNHPARTRIEHLLKTNFTNALSNDGLIKSFKALQQNPGDQAALRGFDRTAQTYSHLSAGVFYRGILFPTDERYKDLKEFRDLHASPGVMKSITQALEKGGLSLEDLKKDPSLFAKLPEDVRAELDAYRLYLQGNGPKPEGYAEKTTNDQANAISTKAMNATELLAHNLKYIEQLRGKERGELTSGERQMLFAYDIFEGRNEMASKFAGMDIAGRGPLKAFGKAVADKALEIAEKTPNQHTPKDRLDALLTIMDITGEKNKNPQLQELAKYIRENKDAQMYMMHKIGKQGERANVDALITDLQKGDLNTFKAEIAKQVELLKRDPELAAELNARMVEGTVQAKHYQRNEAIANETYGPAVERYLKLTNGVMTDELAKILSDKRVGRTPNDTTVKDQINFLISSPEHQREMRRINVDSKQGVIRQLEGMAPQNAAALKSYLKSLEPPIDIDKLRDDNLNWETIRAPIFTALADLDFNNLPNTFANEAEYKRALEDLTWKPEGPETAELRGKVAAYELGKLNAATPAFRSMLTGMAMDKEYGGHLLTELVSKESLDERIQFMKDKKFLLTDDKGNTLKSDIGAEMVARKFIGATMRPDFAVKLDPQIIKALPAKVQGELSEAYRESYDPKKLTDKDRKVIGDAVLIQMLENGVQIDQKKAEMRAELQKLKAKYDEEKIEANPWESPDILKYRQEIARLEAESVAGMQMLMGTVDQTNRGSVNTTFDPKQDVSKELGQGQVLSDELTSLIAQREELVNQKYAQELAAVGKEQGLTDFKSKLDALLHKKSIEWVDDSTSETLKAQVEELQALRDLKNFRAESLGIIKPNTAMAALLLDRSRNPEMKITDQQLLGVARGETSDFTQIINSARSKIETLQFIAINNPVLAANIMKDLELVDAKLEAELKAADPLSREYGAIVERQLQEYQIDLIDGGDRRNFVLRKTSRFDYADPSLNGDLAIYGQYIQLRAKMERFTIAMQQDKELGWGITNEIFAIDTNTLSEELTKKAQEKAKAEGKEFGDIKVQATHEDVINARLAKLQELNLLLTDEKRAALSKATGTKKPGADAQLALDDATRAYMGKLVDIERNRPFVQTTLTSEQKDERIQTFKDVVTGLGSENESIRQIAGMQLQLSLIDYDPMNPDHMERYSHIRPQRVALQELMENIRAAEKDGNPLSPMIVDAKLREAKAVFVKYAPDELSAQYQDIIKSELETLNKELLMDYTFIMEDTELSTDEIKRMAFVDAASISFLKNPEAFGRSNPQIAAIDKLREKNPLIMPETIAKLKGEAFERNKKVVDGTKERLMDSVFGKLSADSELNGVDLERLKALSSAHVTKAIDSMILGKLQEEYGIQVPAMDSALSQEMDADQFYTNLAKVVAQQVKQERIEPNLEVLQGRTEKDWFGMYGDLDATKLAVDVPVDAKSAPRLEQKLGNYAEAKAAYERFTGSDPKAIQEGDKQLAEQYLFAKTLIKQANGNQTLVTGYYLKQAAKETKAEMERIEQERAKELEKAELGTGSVGETKRTAVTVTGHIVATQAPLTEDEKLQALGKKAVADGVVAQDARQIATNDNNGKDGAKDPKLQTADAGQALKNAGTETDGKEAAGAVETQQVAKVEVEKDKAVASVT